MCSVLKCIVLFTSGEKEGKRNAQENATGVMRVSLAGHGRLSLTLRRALGCSHPSLGSRCLHHA